jgi:hypothetical protein
MISKKDLLKKMNISYGQLYRWKREELIPENWFMKLSVSSGQETFFEEELIIPRISKILELKDKYSLEELKDILNGTSNLNLYKVDSLSNFNIFNKKILKENLKDRKEDLNLNEVTFLYLLSFIKDELNGDINYSLKTFPFELIKERLDIVEKLNNEFLSRENLRNNLYEVYDLERLCGKVICGSLNARDLLQIKRSLLSDFFSIFSNISSPINKDNKIFIVSKTSPFKSASIVSSTYDFVGSFSLFIFIFSLSFILL